MTPSLDEVLQRVAAGELTPEEALRVLDGQSPAAAPPPQAVQPETARAAVVPAAGPGAQGDVLHEPGGGQGRDDGPRSASGSPGEPASTGAVRAVHLLGAYRQVTVIADGAVSQVHVTGRHTVRQEGDLLVVDGCRNPFGPRAESGEDGPRFSFSALPRTLSWATFGAEDQLTLRINPDLPLQVDATGTSLRISGLEAGCRLRLLAASLKIDRVRGQIDLDARTSSVNGTLGPTGQSRISAEQSSVKIALLPGTGLQLTATNRMGKVVLPGTVSRDATGLGEQIRSQVGDGRGTLTVESVMGAVIITTEGSGASR